MITVGPPPSSNIDFVSSSSDVATLLAVSFLTNNDVARVVADLALVVVLVAKGDVLNPILTLFRRIEDVAGLENVENASTTTRPGDPPDGIEQKLEITESITMVVAPAFLRERNGFMIY